MHVHIHAEAISAEFVCSQPVDRDPVVYHPDLEDLLQPWPAEVPDEFFEVTVDDVRRRLAQLKSERWVPLALWSSGHLSGFPLWLHPGTFLLSSPPRGRKALRALEGAQLGFGLQSKQLFR